MLKLHGKLSSIGEISDHIRLLTITENPDFPGKMRQRYALITNELSIPKEFGAVFLRNAPTGTSLSNPDVYALPNDYDYLAEGDIVRLNPARSEISTLYRKASMHNTILLTERCNHYCLMCSQPPKNIDDSWILHETFQLINLIPPDTHGIGFSGGEPTLYGDELVKLISHTKTQLPKTPIDILTNGRRFSDPAYAQRFGAIKHPDCVLGIPIYSDDPVRHDYVVQAAGAFDETVRGILNLKRASQKVEIRIVIHKQTIDRLVSTCEFIARNLLFVDHVALMGLEITGFTRANLDPLWIDPYEYKDVLSQAIDLLNSYGMNASVYNHQLCVINRDVEKNYRKSISDWKNEYVDECNGCERMSECGGFFSSSKKYRYSQNIKPFR